MSVFVVDTHGGQAGKTRGVMEKRRESCVYVDKDNQGRIHSPQEIGKDETVANQKIVEMLLAHIENMIKNSSAEYLERYRQLMGSLPKNVWKTGTLSGKDLELMGKTVGTIGKRC